MLLVMNAITVLAVVLGSGSVSGYKSGPVVFDEEIGVRNEGQVSSQLY